MDEHLMPLLLVLLLVVCFAGFAISLLGILARVFREPVFPQQFYRAMLCFLAGQIGIMMVLALLYPATWIALNQLLGGR